MLPLKVLIGGNSATINYEGLAPGAVGLYQFNVVVPAVSSGVAAITFELGAPSTLNTTLYFATQ